MDHTDRQRLDYVSLMIVELGASVL